MRHHEGIGNLPDKRASEKYSRQTSEPKTLNLLQHFFKHLTALDQDFRDYNSCAINLMETADSLAIEQEKLNQHDDKIAIPTAEIQEQEQSEDDEFHYQSQLRGLPYNTVMHREDGNACRQCSGWLIGQYVLNKYYLQWSVCLYMYTHGVLYSL